MTHNNVDGASKNFNILFNLTHKDCLNTQFDKFKVCVCVYTTSTFAKSTFVGLKKVYFFVEHWRHLFSIEQIQITLVIIFSYFL